MKETEVTISTEGKELAQPICEFCTAQKTDGTPLFKEFYGIDDIIKSIQLPQSMMLMQDIVPLGEEGAHLLLMPRQRGKGHDISLALVEKQEEIVQARDETIQALQAVYPYKPIFVFEHGPGFIGKEPIACGGCHMDHAHGHMVALPEGTNFNDLIEGTEAILTASGWHNIPEQNFGNSDVFTGIMDIAGFNPYLHIGMITGNERSAITYVQKSRSQTVQSQLLRRTIAEIVYNNPDPSFWHWRDITEGLASQGRIDELKNNVSLFRQKIS